MTFQTKWGPARDVRKVTTHRRIDGCCIVTAWRSGPQLLVQGPANCSFPRAASSQRSCQTHSSVSESVYHCFTCCRSKHLIRLYHLAVKASSLLHPESSQLADCDQRIEHQESQHLPPPRPVHATPRGASPEPQQPEQATRTQGLFADTGFVLSAVPGARRAWLQPKPRRDPMVRLVNAAQPLPRQT